MPGRVGDVEPVAHLRDPRVLDRGAVEALDAGTEHGPVADALEMAAVAAPRQAEIALVVRVRLGGAVKHEEFVLLLVEPDRRIEDREIFPGVIGMWGKDRIAVVTRQFHVRCYRKSSPSNNVTLYFSTSGLPTSSVSGVRPG